ncbi:MAG TPA: GGDEF domain-containing protein [Pseudomonas sp.]|uniref:GGDEF domain-containing protein n=1 Tax=Pseudomonas sp. TaxID=306 RepID=UPI002CC4C23E|nr:GGDEF domain-containing protein [Pseudomonas sp.]HRL92123.1 GGDEF domain-containing protein [Pseudomonas sp.]
MPITSAPKQPSTYALWREVQDVSNRTRLGSLYYLLAWLLTWGFSQAPLQHLLLGLGGCGFFTLMLVLRWIHLPPTLHSDRRLTRWINRHWLLVLLTAMGWGLAHALALSDPDFQRSQLVATVSTIAFSSAVAFTFSMRLRRGLCTVLLLNLPGLLVLASNGEQQLPILLTLAFYLIYLLMVGTRSFREYHAGIALELQLLEQRDALERLSRTDSLTGLGNRHQFNDLFPLMLANAKRQGSPLALVLMDIDLFKRVNDQHGHLTGDACLEVFAERMRQVFRRDNDILLRMGGEEFAVLMPGTDLEHAQQMAEQFRACIADNPLQAREHRLNLTTSLGVGTFEPARDCSSEAFFQRIDSALFQAKADGRNRLVLAR